MHKLVGKVLHAPEDVPIATPTQPVKTGERMMALTWQGTASVKVIGVSRPGITDERDVIVRVALAAVCGSDLHLYHNELKAMQKGDILGHEFVGTVEQAGSEVRQIQKGMRVAVSCVIADGTCNYCKQGMFSLCDNTNPSGLMEKLFGHRTAGLFGYSHLTGGYPGGQAQFVRVPFADVNCLPLPDNVSNEQAIFLCDNLCTGWHGNALANVGEDQQHSSVAIWGAGPVGLMAALSAKKRGATRIVVIDSVPQRLLMASKLGATDVINYKEQNVITGLHDIIPAGPDVCIECVGFRYAKSRTHKIEKTLMLETDAIDTVSEMARAVRKGGTISLIGDFFAFANHYPIGALMEKSVRVVGGQVFVQKYWRELLERIQKGEIDPSAVVTDRLPLSKGAEAYKIFDEKSAIKVLLNPAE
eukprot:TRINITY_DN1942_c0_g1_i4.p1 TRINITY_DN1942_c0_g1~~TRINITY_DN1942_c0_g1_i4.p1  ORF type:complete len:416 (-),score=100.23 TRINITY_DN1942_c0_g1_i4:620-1867(-)